MECIATDHRLFYSGRERSCEIAGREGESPKRSDEAATSLAQSRRYERRPTYLAMCRSSVQHERNGKERNGYHHCKENRTPNPGPHAFNLAPSRLPFLLASRHGFKARHRCPRSHDGRSMDRRLFSLF